MYRSGPTGFALAHAPGAAGCAVSVMAGARIQRMSAASAKTGRPDAPKLESCVARGLLRPFAVPTVGQWDQKAAARRCAGQIKQEIEGFPLVTGISDR